MLGPFEAAAVVAIAVAIAADLAFEPFASIILCIATVVVAATKIAAAIMDELIAGVIAAAVGHTTIVAEQMLVPAIATELLVAFITSTMPFIDLTCSYRHSLLATGAPLIDFHPSQR